MAQLSKDLFSVGKGLLSLEEAVGLIMARVPAMAARMIVPLAQAEGRVLAEDLIAPIDLPRFDNSAMDGYAVRFTDLNPGQKTKLPLAGRVAAGHGLETAPNEPSAVRIFTGAKVPEGFDTIVMQEDCTLEDGAVLLPPGVSKGANLRRQGKDVVRASVALKAGRRLMPEDIGLVAALGVAELTVRPRLKAAVFSTGDEIVAPGKPASEAGVYDANRFMLLAMLKRQGAEVDDLGILPDNRDAISSALTSAAETHDLILTSGGVSVGEEDHVRLALQAHGALSFWKLAIKPGGPVAMGILNGTPFIGLPGNPVAAFVCFAALVRPLISALYGTAAEPLPSFKVKADFAFQKKPGRRNFVRASLVRDPTGAVTAELYPDQGSATLTSLTRTQGLIVVYETVTEIKPGDLVDFVDYALIR
jgi:molybdopterin molybdotransferase